MGGRGLVRWENKSFSNDAVLSSCQVKSNDLGNILCHKGLGSLVNGISLTLITTEADNAKLSLDSARLDFNHTDASVDKLLTQGVREGAQGGLGGTVDGSTGGKGHGQQ